MTYDQWKTRDPNDNGDPPEEQQSELEYVYDMLKAANERIARGDFRWLIEAPGARYLAVQRLNMSDNFEWTNDHNKALAFRSEGQADALMMAVRQMDRAYAGGALFAFEGTLGNAKPVEHGWLSPAVSP